MKTNCFLGGLLFLMVLIFSSGVANADGPDTPVMVAQQMLYAQQNQNTDSAEENDEYDEYEEDEAALIADPLYRFNYEMYAFNDFMYFALLKPAARGYGFIVPEEIRMSIRNFFDNIRFPGRFINCLLQGKGGKALDEFATFFLNTTVGFLGIADVASHYETLPPSPEDTGQTFAVWGAGNGFYLTLPIFGPSSGRDAVGLVGDTFLDPLFWLLEFWPEGAAVRAGTTINNTSFRIGDYEALKEAALDPYVAIRNAYVQNRNKLIAE